MTAHSPVLEIKRLSTHFATPQGVLKAVDEVDLIIPKGKIVGLVGESGSGKSMLGLSILKIIPRPGEIVGGQILFGGKDLTALSEKEMRRVRGSGIAMIFQDPTTTLNPVLSIGDQMIEAVHAHEQVPNAVARERARDALGMMGIASPEERLSAYPHQLSGGMRQRVAIATAFMNRPQLIVADEPTTALDVTVQAQILAEVKRLADATGTSFLWVTHDLSVLAGFADSVSVMYAGRIVERGSLDDVLDRPEHPFTRGLINSVPSHNRTSRRLRQIPGTMPSLIGLGEGCAFASRCSLRHAGCDVKVTSVAIAPGHEVLCTLASGGVPDMQVAKDDVVQGESVLRPAAKPLLRMTGVVKQFSTPDDLAQKAARAVRLAPPRRMVHAVDNVTITIGSGEVLGLVGESGCGKSTLGRMAAGISRPTAGEVLFHDQPVMKGQNKSAAALRVQMIFQSPYASLNPRRRIIDIIGEAPVANGLIRARESRDYVAGLLKQVGLDPAVMDRFPHQFSGGQRQRVGIARALAMQPEVIIADEAVAALDVSVQAQVMNLLMDLQQKLNLSLLFVSHDLGLVRHISHRVAVMYLGRIVETGTTDSIFDAPAHPYTQALLAEMPSIDRRRRQYGNIRGEIPSPLSPPSGCHFHPRCPFAMEVCTRVQPAMTTAPGGQIAACHLLTPETVLPERESA